MKSIYVLVSVAPCGQIITSVHKTKVSAIEEVMRHIDPNVKMNIDESLSIVDKLNDDEFVKHNGTTWQIDEYNIGKWFEGKYRKLRKNVNEYLKACRKMVDFMHEHLMDLADEQVTEYEELCEAEGEAASKL